MPMAADQNVTIDPELEFVAPGGLELDAELLHQLLGQFLILVGVGDEEANDALVGGHGAASGHDAA